MGKRANPAVIGAFVVGAVVLAVVGVTLFGSGRLFRTTYDYVLYFSGDVNGLKVGAPVKFKGVEIGAVKEVLLNVSEMNIFDTSAPQVSSGKVRIPVIIELDQDALTQKGSQLRPDSKTMRRFIELGLRGQLAMESFVTGLLYVKLDIFPESPLNLVADRTVRYDEIPTLPTPLEEAQMKVAEFFAKLKDLDIKGLVDHLSSTIEGIDALVNSPKLNETIDTLPSLARNLDGAIARLTKTLGSVEDLSRSVDAKINPLSASLEATARSVGDALRAATNTLNNADTVLQPNSPVMFQLGRTLADLAEAARAIRRFAEDLERNPSVLVRGKAAPEEKK
jgi:phospholipid/cholesterol/gamma-HCH transport system substrate-binding protein